jgi:hypothetical protein
MLRRLPNPEIFLENAIPVDTKAEPGRRKTMPDFQ